MSRLLLLTVIAGAAAFSAEFEVASVKPTGDSIAEPYDVQVVPGRLRMRNAPLRGLIQLAYGVEGYQLSGGPSWLASERFDIEAKAVGNPSTKEMQGSMLQALLKDRFKLAVHRETKEGPVYELRLTTGPRRIQPSAAGTCIPYNPDAPPPPAPSPGQPRPNFCDFPHLGRQGQNRTLDGKSLRMDDVAQTLARVELHRPVIDRTDLTGTFDIHLEWTPESTAAPDGLSIFTALREQLGLRLDSARAPTEILVIDRVEKPSEN
jgi:uncharacterized protein (TIGR03435 family)